MNKIVKNSGLGLLIAVFCFSCKVSQPQPQSGKSLLWKISGNGLSEPSYLFGTYHLLGEKFLETLPELNVPLENAKGIVVETEIDSGKLTSIAMMSVMFDKKISTLISPEDFKLVSDELQHQMGIDLKTVDMLKPVQIIALLTVLQAKQLNEETLAKYSGQPLDVFFAQSAKKSGKTVTRLETMEEQFTILLNSTTVEEQAKQLVSMVKEKDLMAKTQVDLLTLYINKDINELHRLMNSFPEELSGNSDYLLKDRNIKWIKALPALMNSGSQFIAVGAGHLPGDNGLISLLQKEGYTVTPVLR